MKFIPLKDGSHAYKASDGDMVDLIAYKFYGDHDGTLELLLDNNKHLAAKGLRLSAGDMVTLPPRPARTVKSITPLWD